MSSGRRAKAPCGHDGEHVVGRYVACLRTGCDGKAGLPRCDRCGSSDLAPFIAMHMPPDAMHCRPCGHVWWKGVDAESG